MDVSRTSHHIDWDLATGFRIHDLGWKRIKRKPLGDIPEMTPATPWHGGNKHAVIRPFVCFEDEKGSSIFSYTRCQSSYGPVLAHPPSGHIRMTLLALELMRSPQITCDNALCKNMDEMSLLWPSRWYHAVS